MRKIKIWKFEFDLGEVFRFGIVGSVATILHYAIYLFFNRYIKNSPTLTYSIGYAFALVFNFLMSNYFTFKTKPTAKKGLGFGFSHFINYSLHILLLNLFLYLGLPKAYAPIPVYCVAIPVNFTLVSFFLKKK